MPRIPMENATQQQEQEKETVKQHLQKVMDLLDKLQLEASLVHKQHMPRHELIESLLQKRYETKLKQMLEQIRSADIAYILEALPLDKRLMVWDLVKAEREGQILLDVSDAVRETLISDMEPEQLLSATEQLETDEIADLAPDLPKEVMQDLLESLNEPRRQRLESVLSYDEESVGALMDFGMVTIREDLSLKAVLRYLRRLKKLPEHTDKLFVIDRDHRLKGVLPLQSLLLNNPKKRVADIMETDVVSFKADDEAMEAALAFERYDLVSAPVVDVENRLVGRICVDVIMDFIRQDSEEEILNQAGLEEEEDLSSSIWKSARNRWTWLMINIVTAFAATRVISLFEGTIMHIVALASLMPIVAAIGGNTGNQTGILIVRTLALGQVTESSLRRMFFKELGIGLLNGIVWGTAVGGIVYLIYEDPGLGFVMAAAMFLNLLVAALMGVTIPIVRYKLGRDPAIGVSVLITFLTDGMGFLIFLGLATMFLL
jgi:magnesium transporter